MRMKSWKLAVISLVIAFVFGCSTSGPELPAPPPIETSPPAPPWILEMESYLGRFAVGEPVDCGSHLLRFPGPVVAGETQLRQSLSCGLTASKARRAFWTFKQEFAHDGWLFQGLVGTQEGAIYLFAYSRDDAHSPGRMTIRLCSNLTVGENADRVFEFQCDR
jgi:hypothetical protein